MKVFTGFLNQNIHGDVGEVGKESMNFLDGEECPTLEWEK
jgi:hypothetical protein